MSGRYSRPSLAVAQKNRSAIKVWDPQITAFVFPN
jgi:hypothetical protein